MIVEDLFRDLSCIPNSSNVAETTAILKIRPIGSSDFADTCWFSISLAHKRSFILPALPIPELNSIHDMSKVSSVKNAGNPSFFP